MNDYYKNLGKRIAALRNKEHLSQDGFAAKLQLSGCNLSRSVVSKIEAGSRQLKAHEAATIAKILSISCDDLLNN